MPARVTYWTGTWDPAKEAISKEVQLLRTAGGRRGPVVSFSPGQQSAFDGGQRVWQMSARQWPMLRLAAPVLERAGRINHIFGGLDASWHLLRSVRRRPLVFTVVLPGLPSDRRIYERVDCFVAEDETLEQMLLDAGIPRHRIRLIHPGIDLETYSPAAEPSRQPFRILFASSPADPAEFEARGIPLLVETARLCPDMEFVLLWRKWGNVSEAHRALERLAPPANVTMEELGPRGMPAAYREASALACLYAPGFGKSCPNSVIEALACGVPALVSESSGVAPLVVRHGAGLAVSRGADKVASAARKLRDARHMYARAARALAEQHFDVRTFLAAYEQVYDELCAWNAKPATAPQSVPR